MKTVAKILICYNSPVTLFAVYTGKPSDLNTEPHDLSERGFLKEITRVKKALQENFTEVSSLAINQNLQRTIAKINACCPDVIFNFVESVEGISSHEYCMAGLFELLGYDFTGNLPSSLGNCLNKERAKIILRSYGIKTPSSVVIKQRKKFTGKNFSLKFPVILKLLNEDASIGISELSVVNNFMQLNKHLEFLFNTYKQEVLVEEFIEGRELNVAILGQTILPISEIRFDGLPENLPKIVTYDGKWIAESVYYENTKPQCPADLDSSIKKLVQETAINAFNAMGCRDYARVDIRLSKENVPYVIEVNPNPDISLDSGFSRAAAASGISYSNLLFTIAGYALSRKKYDTKTKAG